MAAYTKTYDFTDDRDAGVKILAARVDTEIDGIIASLNNRVDKDGSVTPTANLPMGGFKHTGVGSASARDQYTAASQIQDGSVVYVAAGGTGNAITLTLTPAITAYTLGQKFRFKATASNSGATTVNVNSVGAVNIYTRNDSALIGGEIISGGLYEISYDGTRFQLVGQSDGLVNMGDYEFIGAEITDFGLGVNGNYSNITGSVTIDISSTGNVYAGTLTGNVTFTFSNPSGTGVACPLLVLVKQDGTGSRTITWPTLVGGTPTAPTAGAGKYSAYQFITTDGGSNWFFIGEKLGS